VRSGTQCYPLCAQVYSAIHCALRYTVLSTVRSGIQCYLLILFGKQKLKFVSGIILNTQELCLFKILIFYWG